MEKTTLIDTDILIDAARNIPEAISFLEKVEEGNTPAISVITHMELIIGCRSKNELRSLNKFLSRIEIFELNAIISRTAVDLLVKYRLSHGLLIADALIAATAIHFDSIFVSKNQKDFRFIENLNLATYPLSPNDP
ncbi:MAG: type II toxin-antitoxin system VapC family toxin [Calditrichaeota bacterium]|nr:MAG: type II toxin-antitoxin system VapC family toxin [Calditrichota bacterium]